VRTSFLHLADVMLGRRDPANPEVFSKTAEQFRFAVDFAIEQRANFLVFSGNLFHRPELDPQTLQVSLRGLTRLAEKHIEAIAIRGRRELGGDGAMTWHDLLAQEGLLAVLDAMPAGDGQLTVAPWQRREASGGCFDLTRCRVFGVRYFGGLSGMAVAALSRAIGELDNREMDFKILLLNGLLEHFAPMAGAKISFGDLLLLRRQVDYVALGGADAAYEAEGWAYNPGGGGFYHVLVDTAVQPKHQARFVPYPPALAISRPPAATERPRRADVEEMIFDELCGSGVNTGQELSPTLRRDVVRLLTQTIWSQGEQEDIHARLLELAGRDPGPTHAV
jgi:hypothetical protein